MASDPLQDFIDKLASLEAGLADPAVIAAIGAGMRNEAFYLLSSCRQRFPDRFAGAQQAMPFAPVATIDEEGQSHD